MLLLIRTVQSSERMDGDEDLLGPARGFILAAELSSYMWGVLIYCLW